MPERRFGGQAMHVDVAPAGIDLAASVEAGFQAVQPQDTVGDGGFGKALPDESRHAPGTEDGSYRPAGADLGGDPVQAEGGSVGVLNLADAELRCGGPEGPLQGVFRAGQVGHGGPSVPAHLLPSHGNDQDIRGWPNVVASAGAVEIGGQEPGRRHGGGLRQGV